MKTKEIEAACEMRLQTHTESVSEKKAGRKKSNMRTMKRCKK